VFRSGERQVVLDWTRGEARMAAEPRSGESSVATAGLLADIDRLLFVKRHDSVGVYHMGD
jgi:hypothetical protein